MPLLTDRRHEAFAQGVADGKLPTQAYEDAGYKPTTANALAASSSRLLRHVKVAARVQELREKIAAKAVQASGIDAAWLLDRLAKEAQADVDDLYAEDGTLKPV